MVVRRITPKAVLIPVRTKLVYSWSAELKPSPELTPTFSTNTLSPTANGNGFAVVNPVLGVCNFRVTLGEEYVALTIPTPLLLSTANNSLSPLA